MLDDSNEMGEEGDFSVVICSCLSGSDSGHGTWLRLLASFRFRTRTWIFIRSIEQAKALKNPNCMI